MAYKIQERENVYNGEFHGRLFADWENAEIFPGSGIYQVVNTDGNSGTFTINGPFSCYIKVISFVVDPTPPGPQGTCRATLVLECATGFGETDTDTHNIDIFLAHDTTGTTEANFEGGTWRITIDCNHMFELEFQGSFPIYGGSIAIDPPYHVRGKDFLRTLVGGSITVEASVGGASVSATHTFTSGLDETIVTRSLSSVFTINKNGSISTESFIDGEAVFANYSKSSGLGSVSATEGNSVSVSTPPGDPANSTTLQVTHWPIRSYVTQGVVRAGEHPYPSSLRLKVDRAEDDQAHDIIATSGEWTDSGEQYKWSAQASIAGVAQGVESLNQYRPYRAWIAPTGSLSLTTHGEPTNHWRMLIRGFPWAAATIQQAAELQIAGAHGSLTDSSNDFTIPDGSTATGAQGSNSYYTGKASLAFGRFLLIRIRHDDGSSQTLDNIGIGSKTWSRDSQGNSLSVPAGAGYTGITLDLCNPDGTEDTDDQYTKWPIPSAASWAWGVETATSIALNGIDPGVTWDVQDAKIVRLTDSRVTLIPTCENWVLNSDSTTAEFRVHWLFGETDERRNCEQVDFYRVPVGDLYEYTERTIAEVVNSINGDSGAFPTDGYEAADLLSAPMSGCGGTYPPLRDCLLNSDRPAYELKGGGAFYDNGEWEFGFDLDASEELALPGQLLMDEVEWEGGFGDLFGIDDEGVTGPIQIRIACILRGQAAGIVFNDSAQPATGVTVEIDAGDFGSGTTDADGGYQTGSPYVPGNTTEDVSAQVGESPPSINVSFFTRFRARACFRVTLVQEGLTLYSVYQDWHGQLHAPGVEEGNIRYYRSNFSLPIPNWAVNGVYVTGDAETPGEDDNPVVTRNWQDRLFLLFDRPNEENPETRDVWETISDDDGLTWNEATMAIPGGSRPFTITDRNGNQIEAALVGSNIQARIQAAGETTWSDLFAFTDSAGNPLVVEDQPFSFDAAFDSPERYVLAVVIDGESSTSLWYSTDEGSEERTKMSWTRVT